MDPASAIVALIATGISVVKAVKEVLEDIRNAPLELRILRERVANLEMSLRELQRRRMDDIFDADEDLVVLEDLGLRAQGALDKINKFMAEMQKVAKDGHVVLDKMKWLLKGSRLKDLSRQLDGLDDALNTVINLVNS